MNAVARMGVGLLGLAACTAVTRGSHRGPMQRPGDADPLAGISIVQTRVAPQGPRAATYGGKVDHRLTPTEQRLLEVLAGLPMKHDAALSRMTREVARYAPDRVNIPPALVDGLMAWAGVVDPSPRLVVVELPDDTFGCDRRRGPYCEGAIASLVEQVQATMPEVDDLLFGVGVARVEGDRTRMIVSVLERGVAMEPIPSTPQRGQTVPLRGRLLGGRQKPTVEVIGPDGTWTHLPVSVSVDGTFRASFACGDPAGPYQVEVFGDGEHGPDVTANFPLYCGVSPPLAMTIEVERLEADVTASQVAHANFVYLNDERRRRGLAPLQWDERAAEVALRHSADMADHDFFGHRSPQTGMVQDRFARARIQASLVRENLARGYGPKGIHESLMTSPGHRVNMLAADVTHVGIGVVIGPPESEAVGAPRPIYCTQNFFKPPGAGAPEDGALVPTLRERVDAQRASAGLPAARWDTALQAKAQQLAETIARSRRPREGWQADLFDAGWNELETHQVRGGDFDALPTVEVFTQPQLDLGVGVVRTRRGKTTEFVMVVLTGQR